MTNTIALSIIKTLDRGSANPQAHHPNDAARPDDAVRHAIETVRELQVQALERLDDALDRVTASGAQPSLDTASPADDDPTRQATDHKAAVSRLLEAIRHLDRASSLGEILEMLTTHVAREIPRCALLVVRDGRLRCLTQAGFPPDAVHRLFDEPADRPSVIARVIRSRTACVTAESGDRVAFAAPLVVGREVAAVLYADEGDTPMVAQTSAGTSAWPEILEALVSHAARCAESMTLSRLLGDEPDATVGVPRAANSLTLRDGAGALEIDREEAARRYARLLVSEIRLYHEAEIDAGRRHGDVSVRLAPEIARARQLYRARIQPDLADRDVYFEDELVRTLGDAT